jgi:hypothetical protein
MALTTKALSAFAAIALGSTSIAYAQKPLLETKDPLKTQTRLKTSPLKVDVKSPGTAKATIKPKKK